VSMQAGHHPHNLRVLEGPPGKLKGSVMVCREALRNLVHDQATFSATDRCS
jgi:hypothetical protein